MQQAPNGPFNITSCSRSVVPGVLFVYRAFLPRLIEAGILSQIRDGLHKGKICPQISAALRRPVVIEFSCKKNFKNDWKKMFWPDRKNRVFDRKTCCKSLVENNLRGFTKIHQPGFTPV